MNEQNNEGEGSIEEQSSMKQKVKLSERIVQVENVEMCEDPTDQLSHDVLTSHHTPTLGQMNKDNSNQNDDMLMGCPSPQSSTTTFISNVEKKTSTGTKFLENIGLSFCA